MLNFLSLRIPCAAFAAALCFPAIASAGTFQTVYTFGADSNDGVAPMSPLIAKKGLLYGTTFRGGPSSSGTVYAFNPTTNAETVVTTAMGVFPFAPVLYRNGSLFGTTAAADNGQGNIYSVDASTGAATTLYTFPRGEDQASPGALVLLDGRLYGTTYNAGDTNNGSVFEFSPTKLTYTTIYSFTGGSDGKNPQGLVVNDGKLYGLTGKAGAGGYGTVFSIDPAKKNGIKTLYGFSGAADGAAPSGITFYAGLIYGTASFGGASNNGTLFKLDPATSKLTVLFTFQGGAGGCVPGGAPVIRGTRLYGIAGSCGDQANQGTLYDVSLTTGREKVLHTFSNGPDGVSPEAGLLLYKDALYGTASYGGTNNAGTIFKYSP